MTTTSEATIHLAHPNVKPEGNGQSVAIHRPGISQATLTAAGITLDNAREAGAIAIPYHDIDGHRTGFVRWRLAKKRAEGQKYDQERGSGVHVYFPPGFGRGLKGGDLVVVEGEFKSLALAEVGETAIGLPSFGTYTNNEDSGKPELLPGITEAIERVQPDRILFVGDTDTCTNANFSRSAVFLAHAVAPVTVSLVRLPYSGPKGVDDVKEERAAGFSYYWKGLIESAEPVDSKTTMGALAVRLLKRELSAIEKSEGQEREHAEGRIIKMGADLRQDSTNLAKIVRLASGLIDIPVPAVKASVAEEVTRRAKKSVAFASQNETPPESGLYYDGKIYYKQASDGDFAQILREDARLNLRKLGLSHRIREGETLSPCDDALLEIQDRNRVDYAGPLCGQRAGVFRDNGHLILITNSPKYPIPAEGDSTPLETFFQLLLGRGQDDLAEYQYTVFLSWLKRRWDAFMHPEQHLPGQLLTIVGPADCGKSYAQSLITKVFGGRQADPVSWFTGSTPFNGQIWEAEHLAMSDANFPETPVARKVFRDRIKESVACNSYPNRRMYHDELSLTPRWALTLTANDDLNSAYVLPGVDESMGDKVVYLKGYRAQSMFPDDPSIETRNLFDRALISSIPAFVHKLERFVIPVEMSKGRFGVKEFHHPAVLELINSFTPVGDLAVILEQWLESEGLSEHTLPAVTLYEKLDSFSDLFRRVSKSPPQLGHQLSDLKNTPGWKDRIGKGTERYGPSKSPRTAWTIKRGPCA